MKNLDDIMGKRFDLQEYNCWHFVRDVMKRLCGKDIGDLSPQNVNALSMAKAFISGKKKFFRLPSPVDPCIILFERNKGSSHVGVHLAGKVYHMTERGAAAQPLIIASMGYSSVKFYGV